MKKQTNHIDKNKKVAIIISVIVLAIGICLGIYFIARNNQNPNSSSNEVIDEETILEENFSTPSDINTIKLIEISYNNYNDFIYIDSYGFIEYSTASNDNDEYEEGVEYEEASDEIEVDTKDIIQYVFDNVTPYLEKYSSSDEETWSIIVHSDDGASYAGGKGKQPEWFNKLIDKVNATAGI